MAVRMNARVHTLSAPYVRYLSKQQLFADPGCVEQQRVEAVARFYTIIGEAMLLFDTNDNRCCYYCLSQ